MSLFGTDEITMKMVTWARQPRSRIEASPGGREFRVARHASREGPQTAVPRGDRSRSGRRDGAEVLLRERRLAEFGQRYE
jgi:hypothetical protein